MRPNPAGEWKLTFNNLPKYDDYGKLYIYTVKERLTGDFIVQITGNQDSGYVITNKDKPKLYDDYNSIRLNDCYSRSYKEKKIVFYQPKIIFKL